MAVLIDGAMQQAPHPARQLRTSCSTWNSFSMKPRRAHGPCRWRVTARHGPP